MGESKIQITNQFIRLFNERIASSNSLYVGLPVQKEIEDKDRLRYSIPPQQEHILLFDEFSKIANNLYVALSLPYRPIGYVKNFAQLEKELTKHYKIEYRSTTKSKIKIYYCINKLKIIK